jgi:hypothetical protein
VLDAIKEANRPETLRKWATKEEIRAFKNTSDSNPAIGLKARHGFRRSRVKKAEMTESQARALIRKILEAWLNELRSGVAPSGK